jgi:hypothetical protein
MDGRDADLPVGRWDAQERAPVRTAKGDPRHDGVAFRDHLLDRVPQIREHFLVEAEGTLRALTPWFLPRQGVRIAILGGQKLVDGRQIALVEDLLDEAADNRLVLLR